MYGDSDCIDYGGYLVMNRIFFKIFILERQRERERERLADIDRGRSRFHAGNLTWDLIPGLQDHALG